MPIALSVTVVVATTFAGALCVGRSITTRRARRVQLKALFERFAAANRAASMAQPDIDRFLDETADAPTLLAAGTLPILRFEMHEQATRLGRLSASLEDAGTSAGRRPAIVEACAERRAWFERVEASLDALFAAEIAPGPRLRDLRDESLRLFNRAIRA